MHISPSETNTFYIIKKSHSSIVRGVVPGGAGGACHGTPDFGKSVNPISTRETDYAHIITTGTPGFSVLPTALLDQDIVHSVEILIILFSYLSM